MKTVHVNLCERECSSCGKKINRKDNYKRHIRTCKDSTKCPHCEKHFKLSSQRRLHIQRDHKDKLFECENCGKEFLTLRNFHQHNERCKEQVSVHSKQKNFLLTLFMILFSNTTISLIGLSAVCKKIEAIIFLDYN